MHDSMPRAADAVAQHPFMSIFTAFPAVCFILALSSDIAYWRNAHPQWHNFSEWLLFAGLVVGGLVLLVGIVGLVFRGDARTQGPGWMSAIGLLIVLVLGVVNSFVHARDGWTGIVPQGLALSALMVVILLVTGWLGHASFLRRGTKVVSHD